MARDPIRLSFKIDAYSPATIPMARLADYMAELAKMLGEYDSVHFVELRDGSTQLVHVVEYEAFPKVQARAHSIETGEAPAEALAAYRGLNKKLAEDNASATYAPVEGGAEILPFPGIRAPRPVEILPVEQPGAIDGVVIGVGGRGASQNTAPIIVDTGEAVVTCYANRGVAKELGHYVFDAPRRFHGAGQWHRTETGTWALKRFQIHTHEELDETPLIALVKKLRRIPSDLDRSSDPLADIIGDRDGGELN